MRRLVWTCDRCGAATSTAAGRAAPCGIEGWMHPLDGDETTDICPRCITDGERADDLLREVLAPHIFGGAT